jgi:hypothetical protein
VEIFVNFMLFSGDLNSVERAKERVRERFAAIYLRAAWLRRDKRDEPLILSPREELLGLKDSF